MLTMSLYLDLQMTIMKTSLFRASVLPRPRNYRVRRGFRDNLARFFRVKKKKMFK